MINNFNKLFFFISVYTFFNLNLFAGDKCNTGNKKAVKYYNEAITELKLKNNPAAKTLLIEAINKDENFADAFYTLAEIYRSESDYQKALSYYKKVVEICPEFSEGIYFKLGLVCFEIGEYHQCLDYLNAFVNKDKVGESQLHRALSLIEKAKFLKSMFDNPVPFEPVCLKNVSTASDEYLPIISPDNEFVFFTRRYVKSDKDAPYPRLVEEFCHSKIMEKLYTEGETMKYPFNSGNNEGGATISIDNVHLYFTACKRDNSIGSCDIYTSAFDGKKWGAITNLGPVINSKEWDSQPSISSDGKILFFSSNREGGYGGSDLYMSAKDSLGKWGEIINLGPKINTAGNEKSPFIHQDSETLYFSSDGLQGLGGLDIFFTRKEDEGWSVPVNIGHPINSFEDDIGFFVSTDGKKGFFASNKFEGKGGWDIYSFELYDKARPQKVLFLKGDVKNELGAPIENAKIEMINTITSEKIDIPIDSSGKYVLCMKFKNDMVMKLTQDNKLPITHYIAGDDTSFEGPKKIDLKLKNIEIGKSFILSNFYFETNSYSLNDKFRFELESIVEFMNNNPKIKISINGYTDNVGEEDKNLVLSQNRSRAVFDALVQKGISDKRLSFTGFGEENPIDTNDSEKGRSSNRRTEFVIVDK